MQNCGSLYDPSEVLKPTSKVSGTAPSLKETSHYTSHWVKDINQA
ncbi:MAG: class I tRNA ligase family protein [Ignavibacteriales bacterium]|nr:class I tRNA ligase family protein [Ignavibacteriales bacterium]